MGERRERIQHMAVQVGATISYCPEVTDAAPDVPGPWVCEVAMPFCEPDIQGWGSDPLAAALTCCKQIYATYIDLVDSPADDLPEPP